MPQVLYTQEFTKWLAKLRDKAARVKITRRVERLEEDNPGINKRLSARVWEMKIDFGPGYRVYYTPRGQELVVLLAGGDKSTQTADIAKAEILAAAVENEDAS